jgi:hypothetical protein
VFRRRSRDSANRQSAAGQGGDDLGELSEQEEGDYDYAEEDGELAGEWAEAPGEDDYAEDLGEYGYAAEAGDAAGRRLAGDRSVTRGAVSDRAPEEHHGGGPWDGAGRYPQRERLDLGSLLVPVADGLDIQVNVAEEQGVWVAVVRGESALELQAFAASKSSGLWDEVRQEIADEVAKSGGSSREADGPFGPELHAQVTPDPAGGRRQPLVPLRFLGVDGPRWFLRGVISGPAARRPELARPFEQVFADVVVVRGDHPAPPRDLLEITLPEEARQAIEAQMAADAGQPGGPPYPNPFERGPEITETR